MSLLTIIIPTRNRAAYLDKSLESLCFFLDIYDIEILICNNACEDKTSEIVQKWINKYPKIRMIVQPEFYIYDKNVATGYLNANSDYIWILGDNYLIPKDTMKLVISKLIEYSPHALMLNANGGIHISDKEYNSVNEILEDTGWFLTLLCSCIVSKQFVKEDIVERYIGTHFIHFGVFVDNLVYIKKPHVFWLEKAIMLPLRLKIDRDAYMTSWRLTPFQVFGKDWFTFIMSLPFQIPIETKLKCISDHDKNRQIYSVKTMLWSRLSGKIDFSDYKSSRYYMEWVTTTPLWILDIISKLPKLPNFIINGILFLKSHYGK